MMLRRSLTLASALSLLLCVATCTLWVRSYHVADVYWRVDFVESAGTAHIWDVRAARGGMCVERSVLTAGTGEEHAYMKEWAASEPPNQLGHLKPTHYAKPLFPRTHFDRWGLMWGPVATEAGIAVAGWWFTVPLWLVAFAFTLLPAAWGRRRWRRRPRPAGRCPTCGYDLTGNVSGVCPECGSSAKGAA